MDYQEADSAVLRKIVGRRMREEWSELKADDHERIEELVQRVCEGLMIGRQRWMTALAADIIEDMDVEALVDRAEREME